MREGWVYIMTDRYRGALYVGVTASIEARAFQHGTQAGSDFCRRYHLTRLVYADRTERIADAIAREKAMKRWRRAWKIALVEAANPDWIDLFPLIHGGVEEAGPSPTRG